MSTAIAPPTPALPSVASITSAMTDIRASYEAGYETKFTPAPWDLPTYGVGVDHHTRVESELWYMLEFARHVERNDPVVPQGVARFACNVVQGGYMYKPESGVDWIDRLLKERWDAFSDDDNRASCDYQMENNFNDFERLTARRIVFDGDCMVLPMRDGRLQAYEAHNIRSPLYGIGSQVRRRRYVMHGVEKNRRNQVVRYWLQPDTEGLMQRGPRQGSGVMAWQLDPITGLNETNAFHIYSPYRFNQTRGISPLAPALKTAGMHGDIQFAKLIQQQMASYFGIVHDVPMQDDYTPPGGETYICPVTGKEFRKSPDIAPGAEYWPTFPGETIRAISANIPNAEFFTQAEMLLTFIALQLGMPLILFMLDASKTNFSAWRGATDQAKIQFKDFQRQHAARFHRPVARWRVRRFLRQDAGIRRAYQVIGEDLFNHDWQPPGWPYVQPLEDVKADAAEIAANLNSPRRIAARRKLDYETIIHETCEDRELLIRCAIDAASRLNSHAYIVENPDERVTWREVSHPVLPDGLQMQILDKNTESSDERADDESEPQKQPSTNGVAA